MVFVSFKILIISISPMHNLFVICIGFYMPVGAVLYSLLYSFKQKKRLHENRDNSHNNKLDASSFLSDNRANENEAMLNYWE